MKVLAITNDFPPKVGGINYYVAHLLSRFPRGEVTVFTSDWPGALAHDSGFPHRVVRWGSRSMYPTAGVLDAVLELIDEDRPDMVLFGAAAPLGILGKAIEKRTGVPYATFTHGVEVWAGQVPVTRALLSRVGKHARLIMGPSRWTVDLLRSVVDEGPRIEVLPAGVDVENFHPGVSDGQVRDRHGLGEDPVICCVSRLTLRKGQDQVIRALPGILAEEPDARFLVVGGGPDLERLRGLARRKRVEERVVFAGEVPYRELPSYFRAGQVFAMPCRTRKLGLEVEALGAVFLQASAVGRPCVAGDSGGAPEAVLDGETGLVVDGTDVDEVGEAIARLLRDPEGAAKLGARGAEWVGRELTWDALSARLRGLLLDVLTRVP
jgi:phosphatidylinositol alpha-1,6-mannosyltransferase